MSSIEEVRRELVLQSIGRNFEYSESILKWCVTSLMALNGGALISLIGIDELREVVWKESGIFFGIGVLAAMLAAFFFSIAYGALAMHYAEGLWTGDILSRDSFKRLTSRSLSLMATPALAFLLCIVSGGCLMIGALGVAEVTSLQGSAK